MKSDGKNRHFFVLEVFAPGLFEIILYYEVSLKIKAILLILGDFNSYS
jgi:hypothetical protein